MADLFKYEVLTRALEEGIADGTFPQGSKLPSENELSQQYKISRQTVRQAVAKLENAGMVERRRGSGTYVSGKGKAAPPSMNVAVVTTYIDEYIFPSILRGIEQELSKSGYSPIIMPTHNRIEEERRVLQSCLAKDVDGLLVEGTKTALPNPNLDLYRTLFEKGLPVVFFNGYYAQLSPCIYVVADDKTGGYQAAEYLLQKGHRHLAGIFKSDDIQGHERYAGFMQALIDQGASLPDERVFWYTTETKESVFSPQMFSVLEACTAVVCYNDEIAIQLEVLLRAQGTQIPQDLAIVSFDNSAYSDMAGVKITSFSHPKEETGITAAQKLISLISGKKETPAVLPLTLVEKESS